MDTHKMIKKLKRKDLTDRTRNILVNAVLAEIRTRKKTKELNTRDG